MWFFNDGFNILKHLKVNFKSINVLEDETLRQGIKDFSDWPTIPQLYIKGQFIGGCDIVKEMFEKNELSVLLKEKKLSRIIFDYQVWFHYNWIRNFRKFWNSH